MLITESAVYRGPNIYSLRPMVRIQVDLGDLECCPTDRLTGFTPALLAALPGLQDHGCCYGKPGGLVRRLESGTLIGHVAEHVVPELQTLAGSRATRGETRSVKGRPGLSNVMFTYADEAVALMAGRLAFQLIDALLPRELRGIAGLDEIVPALAGSAVSEVCTAEAALGLLRPIVKRGAFGPSTQALVDEAGRRGIPVTRLNEQSLVQLGWGARQRRLRASVTDRTGLVASELAGDKAQAKALLEGVGCPTARGMVVLSADEAVAAASKPSPWSSNPSTGTTGGGSPPAYATRSRSAKPSRSPSRTVAVSSLRKSSRGAITACWWWMAASSRSRNASRAMSSEMVGGRSPSSFETSTLTRVVAMGTKNR